MNCKRGAPMFDRAVDGETDEEAMPSHKYLGSYKQRRGPEFRRWEQMGSGTSKFKAAIYVPASFVARCSLTVHN